MNRTGICGCCEGVRAETPCAIDNRPGLSQCAYRVGTWAQFKASLIDALSTRPSLLRLKTRSNDDFSIALLDSFAVVCDILTFYSERSANEHYLRTATEIVSTRELAKLVGYKPAPGVAASTVLAITIQSPPSALPESPGKSPAPQLVPPVVPIAAGLQAQSVPDPGEQPVTFETVADIEARWRWNALSLRTTLPLEADASNASPDHLRLRGLIGSVAVGDLLLVIVNDGAQPIAQGVNRVAAVKLDVSTQTTLVTFDGGGSPVLAPYPSTVASSLSGALGDAAIRASIKGRLWPDQAGLVAAAAKLNWPLQQLEDNVNAVNAARDGTSPSRVQVFKLGVRAALFGHNAPLYGALPLYTTIGGGGAGSILPDWDSTPATIRSDPWGDWTTTSRISLDQTYSALAKGGWTVVRVPDQPSLFLQISDIDTVSRIGFMLAGKVSRLQLNADGAAQTALGDCPIRTTTLLGTTDEYPVAEEPWPPTISGSILALSSAQLGLQSGQQVIVTGSATDQSGATVSEVHTIAALSLVDGYTQLSLDQGLTHLYDPASVTINANVAPATHGESRSEILGSGDGGAAYQRFVLKQPPLTYVSAATPSGVASTLRVRVNGALWTEAAWLAGRASTDRIYTTLLDVHGNIMVEFGDGAESGARLPSGQNNVTATYRQGIGSAGNVRAGQITTLLTRPLGVQAVINPVAAAGGGNAESIGAARRNVPVITRALDRIVSLEDVGDFARASASVAKAEAVWAWDGRRRAACVTVAGPDGAVIDPTASPFKKLMEALYAASDGTFPIILCTYVPQTFTVGATLTVDPALDADAVVAATKAALRRAFGFDARELMQRVYRSEVFAVLQAIPGVIALTVDTFQRSGGGAADRTQLIANPPTLVDGALVGAELLTLETGPLPKVVSA